jgi:hypothetical protein
MFNMFNIILIYLEQTSHARTHKDAPLDVAAPMGRLTTCTVVALPIYAGNLHMYTTECRIRHKNQTHVYQSQEGYISPAR